MTIERIHAPAKLADIERNLLPTRALLLTVQEVSCPARRLALTDALDAARKLKGRKHTPDDLGAALLAALWEAVACLELAANVAAPWVDRRLESPHGRWPEMTRYEPGRANRFYESSHKWTDQRFASISGHRFDDREETSMVDAFNAFGEIDSRLTAAFNEAENATARCLRENFITLAGGWKSMRGYANSYEHGLLIAPSEYAAAVEHDETPIPLPILVLDSRKEGALFPDVSADRLLKLAETNGQLATDLAEYIADARLRLIDTIEIDGRDIWLTPMRNPIPYWVHDGDLSQETIEFLDQLVLRWSKRDETT
jgi:hypothetical protein